MKKNLGLFLCLSGMLVVTGCGSGGGSSAVPPVTTNTGASNTFVTSQTPNGTQTDPQILGYSATSAATAQTSTVNGPVNDTFIGLTTDSSGNLYTIDKAATGGTFTVNEYAAGTNTSGTTASAVMKSFTSTSLTLAPLSARVDSTGNVFVMLTGGTVLRFAASSIETAAPTATISITGAGSAMTTDSSGNLYVTAQVSPTDAHQVIQVFASGFASAAAPLRTIIPATEMFISSIAVDASGNIYAAGKDASGNVEVAVFPAASTGTSTAMRVITGVSTALINPWQVQVDSAGNIFVADSTAPTVGSAIMINKFSATATGNVAPTLKIAPAATLSATSSMAIF